MPIHIVNLQGLQEASRLKKVYITKGQVIKTIDREAQTVTVTIPQSLSPLMLLLRFFSGGR